MCGLSKGFQLFYGRMWKWNYKIRYEAKNLNSRKYKISGLVLCLGEKKKKTLVFSKFKCWKIVSKDRVRVQLASSGQGA